MVGLDVNLVVLCRIEESEYYKSENEYIEMECIHLMRWSPDIGSGCALRDTSYLAQPEIVTIAGGFGRFDGYSKGVLQRAIEIDHNRCRRELSKPR